MPIEKEQPSLLPWVIVAVLGWMLWQDRAKPAPTPVPPPQPTDRVEKISAAIVPAELILRADVFDRAAEKVKLGELVTDRALLEFVKSEIEKGTKNARVEYDKLCEEIIPQDLSGSGGAGAADFLRACAKSWRATAAKLR